MNTNYIELIDILKATYPDATCSLDFTNPFELVVAVMLSAQCTDERVNKTTPSLFKECNTPEDFSNIDLPLLEEFIHPCGFYKNKAKNIKACAQKVVSDFNGIVPQNMEDLLTLPGVGAKGVAVDTHCKRISNKIGLSSHTDPLKIEQDLIKIFPKEYLKDVNHLFVWHGRNTCTARNPKCNTCTINKFCKTWNNS